MTYSEKLKDPRWQKRRLEIMQRDGWRCVVTGRSDETLHVHHKRYVKEPWDAPDSELETVCETVHEAINRKSKLIRNLIPHASVSAREILETSDSVVSAALDRCGGSFDDLCRNIETEAWKLDLEFFIILSRKYPKPSLQM